MSEEKKPCVIVGVTGGIAVYKTCGLVSSLTKQGYEVHVLMSEAAEKFVTPLTFQTLSHQRVITDMFSVEYEPDVHHVSLAKKADVFVIAPATADVIAKVANGIADDILTTTFLAAECPKLLVPAMEAPRLLAACEYSEQTETAVWTLSYAGPRLDLGSVGDDLPIAVLKGMTEDIAVSREEGARLPNRLRLEVRHG